MTQWRKKVTQHSNLTTQVRPGCYVPPLFRTEKKQKQSISPVSLEWFSQVRSTMKYDLGLSVR